MPSLQRKGWDHGRPRSLPHMRLIKKSQGWKDLENTTTSTHTKTTH